MHQPWTLTRLPLMGYQEERPHQRMGLDRCNGIRQDLCVRERERENASFLFLHGGFFFFRQAAFCCFYSLFFFFLVFLYFFSHYLLIVFLPRVLDPYLFDFFSH
jgi:hypothetical protein